MYEEGSDHLKILWRYLVYAGIEKESFEKLTPIYLENNRKALNIYSILVMIFMGSLGLYNFTSGSIFHENWLIYSGTATAMLIIFLISRFILSEKKGSEWSTMLMVYLFYLVLHLLAIRITLIHPDLPAVTYIGILLGLPFLFTDKPVRVIFVQGVFVSIFCILVSLYKLPEMVSVDIWNAVTFYIVSIAASIVVMNMRVDSLDKSYHIIEQNKKIHYLNRHDMLTGLKNRNAYEEDLALIRNNMKQDLLYIYADINGLHELNNRKGHEAGDEMLQTVALGLQKEFGEEFCYRIGGDEFVVLKMDAASDSDRIIRNLTEEYQKQNYHVSFGTACSTLDGTDIDEIGKLAEQRMYQAKRKYYEIAGNDRRNRR